VTNNDSITIRIEGRDILEFEIENNVKQTRTTFKLKLLDINEDILEVPDIQMNLVTTIPSSDFQRVTRDMSNLSQELSIMRHGTTLSLSCKGEFADQKTDIECKTDGPEVPVGNIFSLKYINMFTKATNLCASVQLFQDSESSEMPIIIRYAIANLGEVKFYLAPKVTD
jgi:proliferating cell nuclear antigen